VKPENAVVEGITSAEPHPAIEVKQESGGPENIPVIASTPETENPVMQNPPVELVKLLITPAEPKPALPAQETNDPLVLITETDRKEENI
jgi:hypothetical protein